MSDLTITRAHIDEAQAGRLLASLAPLTPEELAKDFVRFPEEQHYERARRLMAPRPEAESQAKATKKGDSHLKTRPT